MKLKNFKKRSKINGVNTFTPCIGLKTDFICKDEKGGLFTVNFEREKANTYMNIARIQ